MKKLLIMNICLHVFFLRPSLWDVYDEVTCWYVIIILFIWLLHFASLHQSYNQSYMRRSILKILYLQCACLHLKAKLIKENAIYLQRIESYMPTSCVCQNLLFVIDGLKILIDGYTIYVISAKPKFKIRCIYILHSSSNCASLCKI